MRARLFLLASPAALSSPFSAVAHASSAQGINENSSRGSRVPGRKKKLKHVACLAQRWGWGGRDPAGALWRGVSLGVQFLATSLEKKKIQTWSNVPSGGIQARDNHLVFLQELAVFGIHQD